MKRTLKNYGGLILFYSVLIIGVMLLEMRFEYLNNLGKTNIDNNIVAMNN